MLAQRSIEREVSAVHIANKAVTGPVRINVVTRDNATRINSRGPRALPMDRSRARSVKRDDRWGVLSQSGRTNQRSTDKYSCKQLNDSNEHVHSDSSSVPLHGHTPFCQFYEWQDATSWV